MPPPTPGESSRFYTQEFFAACRRHLREGGALAVGLLYPASHSLVRQALPGLSSTIRRLIAVLAAATAVSTWDLYDLVAAACRRIEAQHGCRAAASEVDPALWLKVDSYSLLQALVYLAGRLAGEYDVTLVQLRLVQVDGRARLDLMWTGPSANYCWRCSRL